MTLSILNITKHSLKFISVNFLVALISVPATIYVATILVPEEYGIYGLLGLWLMYVNLIAPGFIASGYREVPILLGKGEEKEALRIQNVAITSDILYSILPFAVILGASFFSSEPVLKIGLIIVAFSYGINRFVQYWGGVNFLRQNFNVAAKGRLITGITTPLLILASVHWLRVYALLIAPIGAAIISGIYYWRKGSINFHFTFDWKETVRLVKVGVVLQALTLGSWAFRLADRTVIASTLSFEQLGLYVYAIGFILIALRIPTDFGNVLQPILWKEAGKANGAFEDFKDIKRIAIYMALVVAILIPLAQLGFYLIVNLITPKYIGSIPIFYVLSYALYLVSIAIIPCLILNSSVVNKQKITLCFFSIGLALNIIFDLLVIKLGYGVVGVAWVTICTQGLVGFVLYHFIRGYIFEDVREFLKFQARIIFPFLITIPFYFFYSYLSLAIADLWVFTSISLVAQVILWSLVIGIFYRGFIPVNDIKILMNKLHS